MKSLHKLILSVVVVLAVAGLVHASGVNFINDGRIITLDWDTTAPTAGDAVVKLTSKARGGIVGLALTTATASQNCSVLTEGVVDVTVTAGGGGTAIAVGDYVFAAVAGDPEVCTATLTNINTGITYGQALEAIASGSSDRIKVRLMQSGD